MRNAFAPALLVLGAVLAPGPAATAQDAGDPDIDGTWVFQVGGRRGAIVMNFGVPSSGIFTVDAVGFTRGARQFFTVSDGIPGLLRVRANGSVQGTLVLEDVTQTSTVGTLTITGGSFDEGEDDGGGDDRLLLKGTLTVSGRTERLVLRGVRREETEPDTDLTGVAFDGAVSGTGVSSRRLQVFVTEADFGEQLDLAGEGPAHPFYDVFGVGPVRVDGVSVPGFTITGSLIDDGARNVSGRVSTSALGAGNAFGRFIVSRATGQVTLLLVVDTDEGRRFRIRAPLQTVDFEDEPR